MAARCGSSAGRRVHLPHEVALDDRVGDLGDPQPVGDLPAHRRLADPGPAADEQYLRTVHLARHLHGVGARLCGAPQRLPDHRRRVPFVIRPLGRLDAVEELLIAHGVREVGQRFGQGERAGGIARRGVDLPGVGPDPHGRRAYRLGEEVAQAQTVQHGVAPVGVGEVHDDGRPAVAAPVARMEVGVDERVGEPARGESVPAARQLPCGLPLLIGDVQLDGPIEQFADFFAENPVPPVPEPGRSSAGQRGLRGDEPAYPGLDRDGVGRPAVLAGDVLQQHPPLAGGENRRHEVRVHPGEGGDHRGLVGGEVRCRLEPDRSPGGGQPEEARQVPGPPLLDRSRHRPPQRGQRPRGPVQQLPQPVGPRPRCSADVVGVQQSLIHAALLQLPGRRRLQCLDVVGHVSVPSAFTSVHRQEPQDENGHSERALQHGHDRLDLGPPGNVDGEGAGDTEEVLARGHPCAHGSAHGDSVRRLGRD